MASNTVIIFGPTGNIGSVAARTAQQLGAKVVLSMRDTSKTIPNLSADDEKAGGYERVQADLTQPETVSAAVKKTGAKRAFFYLVHGMPNGMRPAVEALKSAGIEFAVFLSSYTLIKDNIADHDESDLLPRMHAQVELQLQDVFGKDNYVGVRPGAFATNTLWFAEGVKAGNVKLPYPDSPFDYISPLDMGRVAGTILAQGKKANEHYVYLFGPRMQTQKEAIEIIGKVLDKNIDITPLYDQEAVDFYSNFAPPFLAAYLIKKYQDIQQGFDSMTDRPWFEEGKTNIQKYSGKRAQTYEEWVRDNKHLFTV